MNLTIKDVPPELHETLKRLAEENGRSFNRQIIFSLEQSSRPRRVDPGLALQRIHELRENIGTYLTDSDLRKFKEEGRD